MRSQVNESMAVSSRPYQSQTFRQLRAGYGRVSRWGRRQVNTLKLVASWSLQVVLYPIYAGFQGTRLLYRQLRASSIRLGDRPAVLAGEAPPQDAPIRYFMAVLRGADFQASLSGRPRLPRALARRARGVACDREQRSLVLIDAQLQSIQLTAAQRHYLERLISWLLTDYAYRYYQHQQRQRLRQRQLPPVVPPALAWWPVRQFHRLMGWMQQASVAPAINLFQEEAGMAIPAVSAGDQLTLRPRPEPQPLRVRPRFSEVPFVTSPETLTPDEPPPTAITGAAGSRLLDDPTWIETEAILVGYVDHPMVALLRWIDRILLWVEVKARRLWHRINRSGA